MQMKNYIELGEKKAGKQAELAKVLGISDAYIRAVKRGSRGLPDVTCIRLADYIEVDRLEVIAASNLVTEKDEEKRKIFESCFQKVASVAAIATVTSVLTLTPASQTQAESQSLINNNINYKQLPPSQLQEEIRSCVTINR